MPLAMIFDMDGTLFQTNNLLERSLEDTFNYLRSQSQWEKHTPIEEYREIMGVPLEIVWETLLPNHSKELRTVANEFFQEKLIDNINAGNGALYPNVEEIFEYLKGNNYSIFIASNGLTDYLNAIVKFYDLDKWVTETFSAQQIHSQDKAYLVYTILQKYQIGEGAVVGDRLSDINAAKSNGLVAIGCNFDFAQADEISQADEIINDLGQIKDIAAAICSWN